MFRKKMLIIIVSLFLLSWFQVLGQEIKLPMQYGDKPAQYILGDKDVLLISVNLWGHVQRPGIYSVPSHFSIIDLLSSAGGPLKTARLNDIRVVRKNREVVRVNIEAYIKTGNDEALPTLQPGDVVIVPGTISDIFGRIVAVFRDFAIIANLFAVLALVKQRSS